MQIYVKNRWTSNLETQAYYDYKEQYGSLKK